MAVHWQIQFKSLTDTLYVLQIYDSNFSGTPVELIGAAHPFETSEEDSEDPYVPIRTQSGYIRFITTSASIIHDIIPYNVTDRPVVLKSGSQVLWVGFLSGEQYDQPWDVTPYEVELPVISVMEAMRGVYFTQSSGYNSIYTILQTIQGYLPVNIEATASTDTPINEVFVRNRNWQEYLTVAQRAEQQTSNIFNTLSIYDIMVEWCKYFSISLFEYCGKFIFAICNGNNYEDYDLQGQHRPSQWGSEALESQTICAANNTESHAKAYGKIKAVFKTNKDKASDILAMDDFMDTFRIYTSLDLATIFYGNSEVQCYHDGTEGVVNVDMSRTQLSHTGGQISRRCDNDWSDPDAWFGASWSDTFSVCSFKNGTKASAIKFNIPLKIGVADGETSLLNIKATVAQGDQAPGQDGIKKLYCKMRVGDYWLHSHHPTGSTVTMLSWQSQETDCWLPVENNQLTTDNIVQFPSRLAVYFDKPGGVILSLPPGVEGDEVSVYFELLANAEATADFGEYTGIIYNISGLEIKLIHCNNDNSSVASSQEENVVAKTLTYKHGEEYDMDCMITTRRGVQYGTGIALDNTYAYVSTLYDKLGIDRRALVYDLTREIILVSIRERLQPIDTVTYDGDTYAILSQSIDWINEENRIKLLKIS